MNKPKSFYDVLNDFGAWFDEPPVPRIEQVQRPVSIDLSQFDEQQREWIRQAEESGE